MKQYKENDVIKGIYKITDVIKDGGTAFIYRARHTIWNIDVAIKIPAEEYLNAVGEDEFKKECENWIELGAHPHIALCYLVTKIGGQLAAISEWTEGGTLYDAIKAKTLYEGKSDEVQKRILKIAAQMLSGIKYAHSRGIINRDIKPQNVLLAGDNIRITDFGLSSGSVEGCTKKYASPEQINGQDVGFETDIYSWAVTVTEMYCGDGKLTDGELAGKKAKELLGASDNAAAAPGGMISLLCECLVQEPEKRPAVEEIITRLKRSYEMLTGEELPNYDKNTDLRTADIENNRAVACIELGETEKAQRHWEKALKIFPNHAHSLYNSAISKDEVWFDQLKKDLEAAGANEENHAEIFEEIEHAQTAEPLDKDFFETDKEPEAISFDDDGKHLLVKQQNGKGVSIDLKTRAQKPSKAAEKISAGASEYTVGERTLLAYFGESFTTSIGDIYNGKKRWFLSINFASDIFCFSPDGKRFAVYFHLPPAYELDEETGEILNEDEKGTDEIFVVNIPEPYSCKYLPSKFHSASELIEGIKRANSLLDDTERYLKAGSIKGALKCLDELVKPIKSGKLSENNIQRYLSLKRELAKHCDKSGHTVLFSKRLVSAPEKPYACAISSDSGLFAFLMPDKTVEIYEMRDNELEPKRQTSIRYNVVTNIDTFAEIWFTENDDYLAVCYKNIFEDDVDYYLINLETMEVTREVSETEPPNPPEGIEIDGAQSCYSADGFTALSFASVVVSDDNPEAFLDDGEDGHPVLHILDCTLTPAVRNRIDGKMTTRKKGGASDNMNKDKSNVSCYDIANPRLQQAREEYALGKKSETAAENRERIFTNKFAELKTVRETLLKEVIGQDHAVEQFIRELFRAELNSFDEGKKGPKAILTFAGPPGTGKSMLAKTAAEMLGRKDGFMQLDMSDYANHNSDVNLIGLDAGYQNANEGALTKFVHYHPKCVLLFDEIEKAHPNILKLFYQMLEDGHLTDKFQFTYDERHHTAAGSNKKEGREKWEDAKVSFKDAIVIFTSNVGRSIYEAPDFSDASAVSEQTLLNALMTEKNPNSGDTYLPAALVSRLSTGKVIMFNKLKAASLRKIAHDAFEKNAGRLEENYALAMPSNPDFEMAMLFSLGGETDARRLAAKVDSYISNELYKILNGDCEYFNQTKELRFEVELPDKSRAAKDKESREIRNLFVSEAGCTVLAYVDNIVAKQLKKIKGLNGPVTDNIDSAANLANNTNNLDFVLIDVGLRNNDGKPNGGDPNKTSYLSLNAKRWSEGKSLFDTIRKIDPETPVYILNKNNTLPEAVVLDLIGCGAAGCIEHNGDEKEFTERVENIAKVVHMQKSAVMLARGHRQLCFSSAFEKENGTVKVMLRELSLERAPLADDTKFLLNDIDIPKERFSDVIGARLAVEALKDYKKFFDNPREFTAGGRRAAPKGVLLYGMPGTGKTMLAKAMAGECGVEFIQKNAAEIHNPDELEKLFDTARKYAPAIIFLDEVDTIAKARNGAEPMREKILNAMLSQMDGFKSDAKRPVFVLAATNYGLSPSDGLVGVLDEAFTRRFDQRIRIGYPDMEDRKKLISTMLRKMNSGSLKDEHLENLAERMAGLSPSDINRVLGAALGLAHNDKKAKDNKITFDHINTAFENIIFGEKKTNADPESLERVATHEAGHTLIYHICGKTPSFLTIEARGEFGGYTQFASEEKTAPLHNREYYLGMIRCCLGGRAAEVVKYGDETGVNSGASADLRQATAIAVEMITQLGMDEKVGMAVLPPNIAFNSEEIMSRVNVILEQELEKAKEAIEKNRTRLDALVEALKNKQRLTGSEIKEILGGGKETTL